MEPTGLPGVFRHGRDLFTRNADPGHKVYGEDLRTEDGIEYRRWDPFRSKLAAYLLKSPGERPWDRPQRILYLGGAHGTTVSHLADALPATDIFVVEKSPIVFAPLLALARRRTNIWPILADAQLPERYIADVGPVDLLYQDLSQRTQAAIFVENARVALAEGGRGLLMLKVRSITQSRPAGRIAAEAREVLRQGGLKVRSSVDLLPFSREHQALALAG
ncbi:MAG TPA: fibrillarin-like rRNA/tRNA 2'-O-methyltransferase [Thermoplasmata archaeon]|nr:fibrillarin-like rRNA/tRNA 2'-O-methyltransferase [Thermoplasmata archaeon]